MHSDRGESIVTNENGDESAEIRVPIRTAWQSDVISEVPTIYANQLLITHAGPEFFLVFGVVTPLPVSPDEELGLTELSPLPVTPVAKIAVSPDAMATMAETIQGNVETYRNVKAIRDKEIWHGE